MAQYLKRWESPRREGRNDKGRGGSARQRQLRKQFKTLKKKLQGDGPSGGREIRLSSLFFAKEGGRKAPTRFVYSHLAPEPKTPIFAARSAAKIGVLSSGFGEVPDVR